MALLIDADRDAIAGRFIGDYFVGRAQTADLTTAEVRTLVNDVDAWLDANAAAANVAITAAVRAKASTATKFAALAYVALKRAGIA